MNLSRTDVNAYRMVAAHAEGISDDAVARHIASAITDEWRGAGDRDLLPLIYSLARIAALHLDPAYNPGPSLSRQIDEALSASAEARFRRVLGHQ